MAALALALAGCSGNEPLNSDRIATRFGSYAVRVLYQDEEWRVSSLESIERGRPVTRTLALVQYVSPDEPKLAGLHERIRAGNSIGITFRRAGWYIDKPALFVGDVRIPEEASVIADLMRIRVPTTVAAHAYRFDVVRHGERFTYATIIELHHPDYLDSDELQRLYRERAINDAAADAISRAVRMLSLLPNRLAH